MPPVLCMLAVALLGATPIFAQSSNSGLEAADQVKAFYRFHFAHDMGFTSKGVKARASVAYA